MSTPVQDLIEKKRDGKILSEKDIDFFVASLVDGTMQEAQIGAMLMAIYQKGLNDEETIHLTRAMTFSGELMTFPKEWDDLLVDKHSTGGVGDKISLILAPCLAALGFKVPMLSGRSLGFTGGTLDKLESIPGFNTTLSMEAMTDILEKVGCFIAGATGSIAPADAILYKLRDVTSTVSYIPLIVSSILSKKVAEGTKALVMDVKVGTGAFLKDEENARDLAHALVSVSKGLGVQTTSVLSRMNTPLGYAIGNTLEVIESVNVLLGKGPSDVTYLVSVLGGVLLQMKGKVTNLTEGQLKIQEVLENGSALRKFQDMLILQGVSKENAINICKGNYQCLKKSEFKSAYTVNRAGIIANIDALKVALAARDLGAARRTSGDSINHSVGVRLLKKPGDRIKEGEAWVEIHHAEEEVQISVKELLNQAIEITDVYTDVNPVIAIIS